MTGWAEFGFTKASGIVTGDAKVDREKRTLHMEKSDSLRLKDEIRVTEDDIPGARLVKNVEDCNCTKLRHLLLCRGAETTGKRADLKRR